MSLAGAEKVSVIHDLAKKIWHQHYGSILSKAQIDYMMETIQSTATISQSIQSKKLVFYLLEDNQKFIGYFAYEILEYSVLLSKCYLEKSSQGKGYFSKVLAFITDIAKTHHKDQLVLYVNKYNPSLQIYEAVGFSITNSFQFDIGQGYIMDDYEMVKKIKEN